MTASAGLSEDTSAGDRASFEAHTMAEILPTLKECSLFSAALKTAGLDAALGYVGMHTLFAPSDSAVGDHPPDDLLEFITEHLVDGAMKREDLSGLEELTTSSGNSLVVISDGPEIRVGGEVVQRADVQCTNGVIHIIGR